MRLVAEPDTLVAVRERGGAVYVWPKASRCCSAWTYTLEAETTPPPHEFRRLHEDVGIEIFAKLGLIEPHEVHLELDRRGRLRAFWNGQAWIG